MIQKALKQLKRAPIRTVALLLFAAFVSVIICSLHASSEAKLRDYEEACATLPITVTVTDPWGGFKGRAYVNDVPEWKESYFFVRNWVYKIFTEEEPVKFYDVSGVEDPGYNTDGVDKIKNETVPVELSLVEYLTDVQVKLSLPIGEVNSQTFPGTNANPELIGISSLSCEPDLLADHGGDITWYEGCDESIFDSEEPLCLIPEGKAAQYDNGGGEVPVKISVRHAIIKYENGEATLDRVEWNEYYYTLRIAGTYTGGDWRSIYCSVPVVEHLCTEMDESPGIYSLIATLADNSRLDEFREKMSFCLPEASPDALETEWEHYADNTYNSVYHHAVNIKSENPYVLSEVEAEIETNHRITLITLAISAVAAFVISLIMILCRKHEIILMRTAGETKARVFFGFILEQMICIILGIALGGACFLWKPIDKLLIFALGYFVCLTLATVIFMSKKLIRTVKED